jgi:hypothetical protein
VNGPSTSTNASTVNGKTTYSSQISYVVKVLKPGKIEFQSPTYSFKGNTYQDKPVTIKITGDELTAEQLDKIEFENFVDHKCKSNGNFRIVFSKEMGFIQKFENDEWTFVRRLRKSEIEMYQNTISK